MRLFIMVISLLVLPNFVFAGGDPVLGKAKALLCIGCHGADGNSTSTDYPKLASQGEDYLIKQIIDFKTGARKEDYMTPMVETVKTVDVADIAAYFSSLPIKNSPTKSTNTVQGQKIYNSGIISKGIPACTSCHGTDGKGIPGAKFPSLAGQISEYTSKMLKDFRSGVRHNDPQKMMQNVATKLSNSEITSLAAFIATMNDK